MSASFDQIAEVTCRNCDWFGMRSDLITVTTKSGQCVYCPECKSDDLVDEDE